MSVMVCLSVFHLPKTFVIVSSSTPSAQLDLYPFKILSLPFWWNFEMETGSFDLPHVKGYPRTAQYLKVTMHLKVTRKNNRSKW